MSIESLPEYLIERLREELSIHAGRVQDVHKGFEIWSEYLTEEERCLVGTFEEAYSRDQGRTIGMWARAKGISLDLATLQLARLFGMPQEKYESLVKTLSRLQPTSELLRNRNRPIWNHDLCELRLNGQVIKQIRNRGTGHLLVLILDAFEEQGWPNRIDDPIPDGPDPDRLRGKVKSLNTNLQQIEFRADGQGTGIVWRRLA